MMTFASWLRHKTMREAYMKKCKKDEFQSPLWIRDEEGRLGDVITSHSSLSIYKGIVPIWTTKQREEMDHLNDTLRLLGDEDT
jgi:hypothetical protein